MNHHAPNRRRPWAKMALSAGVVPALMLGLLALERTDTGPPTRSASDSLEAVAHRSPARSSALATRRFSNPFADRFGERRPPRAGPNNAEAQAGAVTAQGEVALAQAAQANQNDPRCRGVVQVLRQAIRFIEQVIRRFGNVLPPPTINRLLALVNQLEGQVERIIDLCRPPSGVRA